VSVLLIGASILLIAGLYLRVAGRTRSAIRRWAGDYGYRIESAVFHAAFNSKYQEAGKVAEMVYRVVLSTTTGEQHVAHVLLWNLLIGQVTLVVQWTDQAR
jgi:hypothetical protein